MRFEHDVTMVCDGCGSRGVGRRLVVTALVPQGGGFASAEMERTEVPAGWVVVTNAPTIQPAHPRQPDAELMFARSAVEVTRETGCPTLAAFCEPCRLTRDIALPVAQAKP